MGNVFWITGNSGAGKTTLARGVQANLPFVIVLDGDEMRETISLGLGFSKEDRAEHNRRVASLASLLAKQGHTVIVSVIAPYEDVRQHITSLCHPYWVYAHRSVQHADHRPYEIPLNPQLRIDNDRLSIPEAREVLLQFVRDTKHDEPWTHGINSIQSNNA